MSQRQYELVELKPTVAFLSFLTSTLPAIKVPDLRLLQIDNTAYALHKSHANQVLLEQVEANFAAMFGHELLRWFGDKVQSGLEISFLDFLCCFKFTRHSQILLMDPAIEQGQQLLLIQPRPTLLHWFNRAEKSPEGVQDVVEKIKLIQSEKNTIALIRSFANLTAIKPFIQKHFLSIAATAMSYLVEDAQQWPVIDCLHAFNHYFSIDIRTQLIHLPG